MRYLLLALLTLAASAALAADYELVPSGTVAVACSAGGGSAVTVPRGWYEVHVSGETSHVCYAGTCATGGMERVRGNHGVSVVPEGQVSCRSGGTGVVQLVPAKVVR